MTQFITPRGICFGQDYYGSIGPSMYTMFQILTGESWSEAAVRPIIYRYESAGDWTMLAFTYCFFCSFIIINSIVLLNAVVVVLLNSFTESMNEAESVAKEEKDPVALLNCVDRELRERIADVRDRVDSLARK